MTKTLVIALVVLAACGGSDAAPDATPSPVVETEPEPVSDTVPVSDTSDGQVAATTDPEPASDTVPVSDTNDAPAANTPEPPPGVDLADLPTLIASVEAALAGTGDPLEMAQTLGGFPLDIPAPEGSTLYDISSRFQRLEQGTRETSFEYTTAGPGGNVPDVDINLDDNGPGSVQIIDVYDPVMAALGFERNASTASDPGEPGGPNSVNHVYVPETPVGTFNGIAGSAGNVFIWTDEDINGGSFSSEPILGGYRIDVDIDTSEDAPVPVPLLEALTAAVPTPDGMPLVAGEARIQRRSPDAFQIDRGAMYVAVRLEWEADDFDDVVAYYADGSVFADPLMAAEASFFNDGEYEPAEMYVYDGTDRRQSVLLLQRYEGLLGIDAPEEADGPVRITLDLDLDSIAPKLSAPSD
ncbi:MAG: hypothetical protein HKN44_06700 [Ilumatobacter sp.]|nr:hypothetical protein [Ilumatobacter sp.]